MSGTQYNQDSHQTRPEHRLHDMNEPLQRTHSTTTGVTDTSIPPTGQYHDPTLGHTAGAGVPNQYNTTQDRTAGTGVAGHPGQQYDTSGYFPTNASSNRPLNDEPIPQDGVPFDLPFGYPDLGDKIIGKTQKIMGRMTNNPRLHEKGELRESGGKAAVLGLARPPHNLNANP